MRWFVGIGLLAAATPALAHGGAEPEMALPFLVLGFVVGLIHALDADHITAVAAMMNRGDGRRGIIARGVAWGLGHTLALFLICSAVILLGLTISEHLSAALEMAVGVMIVLLGVKVLWTMWHERIHIHVHEHDGERHIHAHSHKNDTVAHRASAHGHSHSARAMLPTLSVGLLHGAAGSAGLLVLTMASAESASQAMATFALFGIGSLAGMTALTAAASYPLGFIHGGARWMRVSLALTVGGLALFVGGTLVLESYAGLQTAGL